MVKLIIIVGAMLYAVAGCSPTDKKMISDLEMEAHFFEKETCYRNLIKEILDKKIYRMELTEGKLEFMPAGSIPKGKESYISELMSECLGVSLVNAWLNGSNAKHEVAFYSLRKGFVFGGRGKGLVHLGFPPPIDRVVSDLDIYEAGIFSNEDFLQGRVYKKIKEHWYIFFEYND